MRSRPVLPPHCLLYYAAVVVTALGGADAEPGLRLLYQFPYSIFLENIAVRPNGHLVINTFDNGRIYGLDPSSPNQTPEVAVTLPGVTASSGIAEVAPDVFAVSGGILNFTTARIQKGSGKIFLVDFRNYDAVGNKPPPIRARAVAAVPDTESLNGMTALPRHPHVVLSVDSIRGRIFRTDTTTGAVNVVLQHPLLATDNATTPGALGGNGLKFREGYLYFTNSILQLFARVKMTPGGEVAGSIEEIVSFAGLNNLKFDDFAMTKQGVSYIAAHPNTLVRLSLDGKPLFITGQRDNIILLDPTSAALSRDERKLYIVTAGGLGGSNTQGGQVVELQL